VEYMNNALDKERFSWRPIREKSGESILE